VRVYEVIEKPQEQSILVDKVKIEKIFRAYFSTDSSWQIKDNGSVDIDGDCILKHSIDELPIRFGIVKGDFRCEARTLKSLIGAPTEVGGSFQCSRNDLSSLEGAPLRVHNNFGCSSNKLTSLIGRPTHVGGYIIANGNQLTSMVGFPKHVSKFIQCYRNNLISLDGFPETVGQIFCCHWSKNLPLLRTLQATHVNIVGPGEIEKQHPVSLIINECKEKEPNLRRAILDAQKTLIEAGYTGNARW
jgi:hypothetical protein